MSPKGQPKKARSGAERKRRASSSSVSSVSSVSSLEDLSDDADGSDEDADDEEDRPLAKAPSYNRRQNKGRKTGRQPVIKKRRVSDDDDWDGGFSSNNSDSEESSDDVYAAVDYITDAEDEEQDVEKLEEMMILESENHQRVLLSSEVTEQWNATTGFGDSMFLPAASFFDEEHLYNAMDTFGETDLASESVETPVARRVHFEERSDSSSDSESHTDDEIPSDFLQQDSLDPQLRRMIENDNHGHHRSHRRQSEEIYADTDYGHGNIYHVESDGTSEGSLSGYESMLAAWTCFLLLLIKFQPTMVIPLMKTFPLPLLSPTPALFFAAIPPTPWPLSVMTSLIPCHVGEARSWVLSRLILTNP